MKINCIILTILSSTLIGSAIAQDVEVDDMYFNSQDRAKQKALTASVSPREDKKREEKTNIETDDSDLNPTDSYSARNVNPEFVSRSNSEVAQSDNEDYFVNNYQVSQQRRFNSWNNNFNSWYDNSWYSLSYWGPGLNRWNAPYYGGGYYSNYGGYYDPWMDPWCSPYNYGSGWSWNQNYSWGNRWSYGWGSSYGWGNPYYLPYSSYYSNYYSPYGGWYGNPSRVVVVDRDRGTVYGKRTSRSSGIANSYNPSTNDRAYSNRGSNSRSDNSGRLSTRSRQSDYYDRSWRNSSQNTSSENNSNSNSGRITTWSNDTDNSRSTFKPANNNTSTPVYDRTPARTNSSWDGGGSRSTGSSNNNSNSGSRSSRGRGN